MSPEVADAFSNLAKGLKSDVLFVDETKRKTGPSFLDAVNRILPKLDISALASVFIDRIYETLFVLNSSDAADQLIKNHNLFVFMFSQENSPYEWVKGLKSSTLSRIDKTEADLLNDRDAKNYLNNLIYLLNKGHNLKDPEKVLEHIYFYRAFEDVKLPFYTAFKSYLDQQKIAGDLENDRYAKLLDKLTERIYDKGEV